MKNKVYLVDGSGYIFRAFFAVTSLSTKAGFPTNALFGFTRMLKKLLAETNAEHIAVAFDVGRQTFRLEMYPQYKANRAACPEELLKQMPYFREIVDAIGIQVLELQGYEADDVIGTLARRLSCDNADVVIVSGDKDLTQLIKPGISIYDPMHDKHYNDAEVKEKFGVKPSQVVELLALTGDSSDNVPGVDGVGPKTAAQLIEKYGNVETVIGSIEQIKADPAIRNRKKIAEQIESGVDTLRLSRKLVEIKTDSPVSVKLGDEMVLAEKLSDEELLHAMRRGAPKRDVLSSIIQRFEFSSLFQDFNLQAPPAETPARVADIETPHGAKYHTVLAADFPHWIEKLKAQKEFAFDIETTSLDTNTASPVGFSFCWSDSEAYYVPVGHRQAEGQVGVFFIIYGDGFPIQALPVSHLPLARLEQDDGKFIAADPGGEIGRFQIGAENGRHLPQEFVAQATVQARALDLEFTRVTAPTSGVVS